MLIIMLWKEPSLEHNLMEFYLSELSFIFFFLYEIFYSVVTCCKVKVAFAHHNLESHIAANNELIIPQNKRFRMIKRCNLANQLLLHVVAFFICDWHHYVTFSYRLPLSLRISILAKSSDFLLVYQSQHDEDVGSVHYLLAPSYPVILRRSPKEYFCFDYFLRNDSGNTIIDNFFTADIHCFVHVRVGQERSIVKELLVKLDKLIQYSLIVVWFDADFLTNDKFQFGVDSILELLSFVLLDWYLLVNFVDCFIIIVFHIF